MHIIAASLGCIYGAVLFVPLLYPLKLTSSFEVSIVQQINTQTDFTNHWRIQRGARDACPLLAQFFQVHTVFEKKMAKIGVNLGYFRTE